MRELFKDSDIKTGLVPADVLAFWRQKGLKPSFDYRDTWNEEHDVAFSVAKVMRMDVLEALHEEIGRGMEQGLPFDQWKRSVKPRMEAMGWWAKHEVVDPKTGRKANVDPPARLKLVYETNMRLSHAAAQYDRVQRAKKTRPFLLYQVGPSERHRPEHLAWHGLLLPTDSPFWQTHYPSNGYNCFLPGTRITGAIIGGSKAWYSGEAVELVTKSGATLSVTPNHPVATSRGWLRAGNVDVGDHCVSHRGEVELVKRAASGVADRAVSNQQVPSRIENVFDSLASHGSRLAKVSSLDFHGEAQLFVGQVETVGSYIELANGANAALSECDRHRQLTSSYPALSLEARGGHCAPCFNGVLAPSGRFPSRLAERYGLRAVHPLPPLIACVGAPAHLQATTLKKPAEGDAANTAFLRELLNRGAGQVALDQIISIRRFPYSGHVYDLESESGWILAGGIVASNCKCNVRSVSAREADRLDKEGVISPIPKQILGPGGLPTGHIENERVPVVRTAPKIELLPWKNRRTGKEELVPRGIDPGFHHLPGVGRKKFLEERLGTAL